jgi:hypothetical protein
VNHLFKLCHIREQFVSTMPLGIIRPLHPGPELGCPAPMVPQFKENEIDRLIEGFSSQQAIILQGFDHCLTFQHPLINLADQGVTIGIELIDPIFVVALTANGFHTHLVILPGRAAFADRGKQVPGQSFTDIMGGGSPAKSAQVAGGAGRCREVLHGQQPSFCIPVIFIPACRIGDPVRGFGENLELRVIRANMAGVAGFRFTNLLQAEFVAQVALLTLADRPICGGLPMLWQASQAKRVTSGPSM